MTEELEALKQQIETLTEEKKRMQVIIDNTEAREIEFRKKILVLDAKLVIAGDYFDTVMDKLVGVLK